MSDKRSEAGSQFHVVGPLTAKLYAGRSLSWYVVPLAYRMTPIAGADDLGRTQLVHRGQPAGSEKL